MRPYKTVRYEWRVGKQTTSPGVGSWLHSDSRRGVRLAQGGGKGKGFWHSGVEAGL